MRKVKRQPFPDPLIEDAKALGQAVRAARTGSGLSLEFAAQALGISKATLSDLEVGTGTVALGTALRVARELGMAVFAAPLTVKFEASAALNELRQTRPSRWGDEDGDTSEWSRTVTDRAHSS